MLPFTLGRLFGARKPRFNVQAPESIESSVTILAHAGTRAIFEIAFAGRYPPGSFGNLHAERMQEISRIAIQEHQPAAILFNLMSIDYVWGDAMMGVLWTAWERPKDTVLPCCILAAGRTASALEGLLSCLSAADKEPLGARLVQDRDKAVRFLKEQIQVRGA